MDTDKNMIAKYLYYKIYRKLERFITIRINLICTTFILGLLAHFNLNLSAILIFFLLIILWTHTPYIFLGIIFLVIGWFYTSFFNINLPEDYLGDHKATVVSQPEPREFNKEVILKVEGIENYILTKVEKYYPLRIHDQITFTGEITPVENQTNSEFDYKTYNLSRQVIGEVKKIKIINKTKTENILTLLNFAKTKFEEDINGSLSEPGSSLMNGILFGDDSTISPELKENLKNTGIYHIISVSGFNVSIIFSAIFFIASKLLNRRKSILIALIFVFVFMFFIGLENLPVMRATLMLFFIFAGLYLGRKVNSISALLLSTTCILIIYPYYILNLSLLLSTFATLGILITGKFAIQVPNLLINNLFSDLKTSLAAIISTSFITFAAFKEINLTGIITNFFILPFIPLVMLAGGLIIVFKELSLDSIVYLLQILVDLIFKFFYLITDIISINLQLTSDSLLEIFILLIMIITYDFFKFKKNHSNQHAPDSSEYRPIS